MAEMKKWTRIHYMPHTPLYEGQERVTGSQTHIDLSRHAAADGTVLLKNERGLLPLCRGERIAVFGKAQSDYVKGGGGSGDVTTAYVRSLLQGLRIKQSEGKLSICDALSDFYDGYVQKAYANGYAPGRVEEPELSEKLLYTAMAYTDTAIITLCRYSGEGMDRMGTPGDGDFYLCAAEERMIQKVLTHFNRVVVVLNVGGIVDTTWIKNDSRVGAALLPWQGGMEGGLAIADVLCGDACPNGRLTDTFAENFDAYPSADCFHESEDYVEYQEDIYVGYRYFETIPGAAEKVCYPFGYGLSYTEFKTDVVSFVVDSEHFCVEADVQNVGKMPGRDVLQLYVKAPQGRLGKAARSLVGFQKTKTLEPGQTQRLCICGKMDEIASFDDVGVVCRSAYVLEAGEYAFYLGRNVRDAEKLHAVYTLEETCIVRQLTSKCAPRQLSQRLQSDGSIQKLPVDRVERPKAPVPIRHYPRENQWDVPCDLWWPYTACGAEAISPQLIDVYDGKMSLDDFVSVLTLEQKISLLGGQPNRGVANTFGYGNLRLYGVPNAMTADGPAGLRIKPECHVFTTAFPCATLMACTWDAELVFQVETAAAEEVKENGFGIWLAPALNIHRNPLCGRNFEYYSEDPLLSGMIAAAAVSGIQSQGIAATIKHFACNNKETNRVESDSRVSERALREIYLKGFEICIKRAKPWVVMSSYNLLNGVHTSANRELLMGILREEWGFDGMVSSDWDNTVLQYQEIAAGNDLKMCCGMPEETLQMVQEGKLSEEAVEQSAKRVLQLILRLE